jgi:sugar-specific transcriptional regulator TrmB
MAEPDLFSILSNTQIMEIVSKQSAEIEELKKKLENAKKTSNNGVYTYKQSTIHMMSEAVSKAKKEALISKSLLYEIYDCLDETVLSHRMLTVYKQKIREVYPELINKSLSTDGKNI